MKHYQILIVGVLSACVQPLPPDDMNAFTLCAAGRKIEVSASLAAKVEGEAKGGSISASAKDDLRGAFLSGEGLANDSQGKAFDAYLRCLESRLR